MKKLEASNAVVGLASAVAVGTVHFTALLYARDHIDGNARYVYTGLAIVQGLGLLVLSVGQGAALYVSKTAKE